MFAPIRRNRRHDLQQFSRAALAGLNRLGGARGSTVRKAVYGDVHDTPVPPQTARQEGSDHAA